MERAGVDVITDGEMRRESYSNRFATALDGVDLDNPGVALDRTGHENPVPRVVGADPPHAAGRGSRRRVPPLDHRPPDQDHRARPVHDDAAGPERPLRRRSEPRARVRGGRQRGAARPQVRRRRRRPDRRAVSPGAPRAGARVRDRGDQPRARRHRGRDGPPHLLRLRAHRPRPADAATRSCASSTTALATHLSLEAAQPDLDPEVLRDVSDKTIVLGVLDLGSSEAETPDVVAERIRQGARGRAARSGSSSRRTAG